MMNDACAYFLIENRSIQVRRGGCKRTVWVEKIEPVKIVETHSFLLLTHFLATETSKFQ